MEDWGGWLKGQRILAGVSLAEMERSTQTNRHVIRLSERGERIARPPMRARLLVALGLPGETVPVAVKPVKRRSRSTTGDWWKDPAKREAAQKKMRASQQARRTREWEAGRA
jgi:hypothetical protein